VITMVTALILGIGGSVIFQRARPFLLGDGCQATVSGKVVQLDSQQAAIAATIAGVAYRRRVPKAAVTVAYAAALQESHLHNVDYGDRDSLGIFQQRPSAGWGTPSQLMDPVYAATRFFAALVKVPGYQRMPVDRAAQAVQHSADGTAYGQYEQVAGMLSAAFTGDASRAVSCWYTSNTRRPAQLTTAMSQLSRAFGRLTGRGATGASGRSGTSGGSGAPATTETAARELAVNVPHPQTGWAVATWSVAHAKTYGIRQVRYAGYLWRAANGQRGWRRDPSARSTDVQLS
jgi:hypothetical protein